MLIIRREQLHLMGSLWLRDLVQRLRDELPGAFPADCSRLGADQLTAAIERGVEKARSNGFRTEDHIRTFVRLLFTFGRDFEVDPHTASMARILSTRRPPGSKMEALLAEAGKLTNGRTPPGYFAQTELVHGLRSRWEFEW